MNRGGWFPRWTQEENDYLRHNWGRIPAIKIATTLQRSLEACYKRARIQKVRSKFAGTMIFKGTNYKGADFYNAILTDYASMSYGQIAKKYKVPEHKAKNWIHRAKLYRDRGKLTNSTRP